MTKRTTEQQHTRALQRSAPHASRAQTSATTKPSARYGIPQTQTQAQAGGRGPGRRGARLALGPHAAPAYVRF